MQQDRVGKNAEGWRNPDLPRCRHVDLQIRRAGKHDRQRSRIGAKKDILNLKCRMAGEAFPIRFRCIRGKRAKPDILLAGQCETRDPIGVDRI